MGFRAVIGMKPVLDWVTIPFAVESDGPPLRRSKCILLSSRIEKES